MDYKDYLEHYGVLGMHWGIRKDDGHRSKRQLKKDSKLAQKEDKIFIKDARDKLNEELQTRYAKDIKDIRKHLNNLYDFTGTDTAKFYQWDKTLEEYGNLTKAGWAEADLIDKLCKSLTVKVQADYKDKLPKSPNGLYSLTIDDVDYAGDDGGGGEPYARIYDEVKKRQSFFMSDFNSEEEFLEHYGVLGMHWGIRKDEGGVTTSRREAKRADKIVNRTPSEDHIRKQILQRKKTLALTNAELRLLNERLQLEQTYRNLSPKKITLGKSWNDSFMKKQATTTRNQFASQASAALIKKALLGVI